METTDTYPLTVTPIDCGYFTNTERSAHQYLVGFGEKVKAQSILWLIRGGPYPVVVDLPPSHPKMVLERYGRDLVQSHDRTVRDAVRDEGVDPDDIGAVVLTHLHWDHSVGLDDNPFPNAEVLLQYEELRYAAAPYPSHSALYDRAIVEGLVSGRGPHSPNIKMLHGDSTLFDGLRVLHLPGHTPGLQGVVVNTEAGRVMIASDNVPFQSSWRGRTPSDWTPEGIHVSLEDCYESLSRISLEADIVMASHDRALFGHPSETSMSDIVGYGIERAGEDTADEVGALQSRVE